MTASPTTATKNEALALFHVGGGKVREPWSDGRSRRRVEGERFSW
jgi:hypothetical protein